MAIKFEDTGLYHIQTFNWFPLRTGNFTVMFWLKKTSTDDSPNLLRIRHTSQTGMYYYFGLDWGTPMAGMVSLILISARIGLITANHLSKESFFSGPIIFREVRS